MSDDFYSNRTYDWQCIRGDTLLIKMEILDRNKNPIDMNVFNLTFSIKNTLTDTVISELTKTRDGESTVPTPNGIFTFNDVGSGLAFGMGIDADNKLVIRLLATETSILSEGVYTFDLQMVKTGIYDAVFTQKGRIIIVKDITRNV